MAGWYKLDETDAMELAAIINKFKDKRSRPKRTAMVLYLWSQMMSKGSPCPYVTCGIRTIANGCGVTDNAAKLFLKTAESDGYLLRIGTLGGKYGQYVKRTFRWVAERAAKEDGMTLNAWLEKVNAPTASYDDKHESGVAAIETKWHGCRFRSRLEARWAVLFEAMGIDWEYEPMGFALIDGTCYLPDFILHGVGGVDGPDLFVEVKGRMTGADSEKVKLLSKFKPIYVVGDLKWSRGGFSKLLESMDSMHDKHPYYHSLSTVNGTDQKAFLGVSADGMPRLFTYDQKGSLEASERFAIMAYRAASAASFEPDGKPENSCFYREAYDEIRSLRKP